MHQGRDFTNRPKTKPEVTSDPRSKQNLLNTSYLAIFPRTPAMAAAAGVPGGSPGSFITGAWLSSVIASGGVKRQPAGARTSLMMFSVSLDSRYTPYGVRLRRQYLRPNNTKRKMYRTRTGILITGMDWTVEQYKPSRVIDSSIVLFHKCLEYIIIIIIIIIIIHEFQRDTSFNKNLQGRCERNIT